MDVESLAKQLILQNMTPEQQTAVLDSIRASVLQAKDVQKQRIGENVQVVVQALKKIESDIKARYDETGKAIEKRVASIKDGQDGRNGVDGKAGKDGRPGRDGAVGPKGADGLNGRDGTDGENGVSVTDAHIDFDGSLVISLSSGRVINVGEVVAPDLAEKIKVITNGGGTSQTVIDTLASLQTQINNIYPSQTGNSGKFLTTNGTAVSWANVAGGLSYQGTWNASTNTPTLASGTGVNGYYYITATAGSTNLDGITDWQVGDWLIFNGTSWQKIDQSNLVTSVNGQTGAVSLLTTNISEGTNLYYTDARARASVSAGTGISYSSATGVITNAAPDQTVALTAGTGISTTGTYPNFTIANTAPDQTVALTQGGTTTITGTYPNFTISSSDQYVGTVTGVTATSPVVSSGGTAPAISLASGYGDTLNPYASKTANFVLAAPNGSAGVPTFRAVVAADIPTLNQNTTGTAANVTGTVAIANGGTGQTTATAGFNALAPSQTSNSGKYLSTDGTNTLWAAAPYSVEVVLIAGGGSGGATNGGGGGAGGVVYVNSASVQPSSSYTTTVGAGGAASTDGGNNGSNSVFGVYSSVGGGAGQSPVTGQTANGGSGGGGKGEAGTAGGSATAGQGNNGGAGQVSPRASAGGGGKGAAGQDGSAGGVGGSGTNDFTTWATATSSGVSGFFAGGGGGGTESLDRTAAGGSGGGGASGNASAGVAGTANTGSGGGGGSRGASSGGGPFAGGAGGSGIVIIRYAGAQRGSGGTVYTYAGYTYHKFTSSGTYTG